MRILVKRTEKANDLIQAESRLKSLKTQLSMIKTQIETMKTEIDSDADYPQSDKDYMQSAFNLVNNVKYTDFISFIQTQLGN